MCDKCGARALWVLMVPRSGNLEFCNHHRNQYRGTYPACALMIELADLDDSALMIATVEGIARISNLQLPKWPMSG